MAFETGSLVAGRYRVDSLLGEGGMGEVWAATHAVTRRSVALKVLRGRDRDSASGKRRLFREARAASAAQHENVVEVLDAFELADGSPVMVTDRLDGETLASKLARDGALSVEETASVLLPVVSAVGSAHALGVAHRDLKPENVFLARAKGTVVPKVLDFGIATNVVALAGGGAALGTPLYMAPEQATGGGDHRVDVWALGVLLYECLSGIRPIEGASADDVRARLMDAAITPIGCVADVPDDVCVLVDGMLRRDPAARPALSDALSVLEAHTTIRAARFALPGSRAVDLDADLDVAFVEPRVDARAARPTMASPLRVVVVVALAGVALSVGWLTLGRAESGAQRRETPAASTAAEVTITSAAVTAVSPPADPTAVTVVSPSDDRSLPRAPVRTSPPAKPVVASPKVAATVEVAPSVKRGLVEQPPF